MNCEFELTHKRWSEHCVLVSALFLYIIQCFINATGKKAPLRRELDKWLLAHTISSNILVSGVIPPQTTAHLMPWPEAARLLASGALVDTLGPHDQA